MPLSAKSLAGPGYIILNAIRVMNIVALLAVVVGCVVMLIKIKVDSQFFIFDAITHVIETCVSLFLIVSECTLFRTYFSRNWPLLSPAHGFVFLGLAMATLGVNMLANLNQPELSKDNFGLAFWRIVMGAGILSIILGVFNVVASFVFRDRTSGVTARQVRAKGAVALLGKPTKGHKSYTLSSSASTASTSPSKKPPPFTPHLKTPDPGTKSPIRFPHLNFNRRSTTLPSYSPTPRPSSSHYSDGSAQQSKMKISGPIGINPQFAHLVRPDSAYHPSRK